MPFLDDTFLTEASVLPSLRPITLVGVLDRAKSLSLETSVGVHDLPLLRVLFAISQYLAFSMTFGRVGSPTYVELPLFLVFYPEPEELAVLRIDDFAVLSNVPTIDPSTFSGFRLLFALFHFALRMVKRAH